YAWEAEEVRQLWGDIRDNDPPYFLGILLIKPLDRPEKNGVYQVIDGQQRLATLILLISSAVEIIAEADKERANAIRREFVDQHGSLEDEPRPTLTLSRRDNDKFQALTLGRDFKKVGRPFLSWTRLDKAKKKLKEEITDLKEQVGVQGVLDFLRERVLGVTFLDVHLESDSDVYLFFETLNDRGMDLSIADLVKNQVCSKADREDDGDVEVCAAVMDDICRVLGDGKIKQFLLHFCWANDEEREPRPRKRLMDWYRSRITESSRVREEFLAKLERFAQYYAQFVEPRTCTDSHEREVFTSLKALEATRCYPLLLRAKETLLSKDFIRLARALEILTFRHSTILGWDAKNLETVYYRLAQKIGTSRSVEETIETLRSQDAMREDKLFAESFKVFEPQKQLAARYALWKIERARSPGEAPLDWERLTVEHILAKELDWEGKRDYLHRLGNLTLLSREHNSKARNSPFNEKKEAVFRKERKISLTKDLLEYESFHIHEIEERQSKLLEEAFKIWCARNMQ
ncbi:MAG: hypothetical protein B1H03_05105, partial [Planctomycetales bacterium 4484_113]